jgi:hypothetical protein
MSEIKGDSFDAARILSSGGTLPLPSDYVGKGQVLSGGLEFSKAGFCWISNGVLCSYQKSVESGMLDRCRSCPEMKRALREEDEEDEAEDREVEEVFRRQDAVVLCRYDGKPCLFNEHVCEIPDDEIVSWFCCRKPSVSKG